MESIPLLESNQFTTSINVNDENDESEYFAAANATPNFNYRERSRRAYLKQRKVIFYIIFHIVMSLLTVLLLIFFSTVLYANGKQSDSIHEQVHLSLTRDARSMMVTWVTFQDLKTDFPLVKYGRNGDNLDLTQTGYSTKFVDTQGTITRYIHRVNLTELSHQTKYYYEVGKDDSWSNGTFHFTTFPEGTDFGVKMCVYGDMSVDGKATLPALIRDVKNGRCQMLIHLGDISYQLQKNDGKVGDEFMREMEPAVAFVPFMVIPGNHEFNCFGFSHYENRFTMPVKHRISDADSYYSLTVGPINLFAVSSEVYGHLVVYGKDPIKRQAYQLENDLQLAEAIKADRPWKIGYQHRPLYCYEEYYDKECNNYENKMMRSGFEDIPGLEDLYQRYSMDLMLVGHEHAFEKLWPLFNRTVYKYLDPSIFLNPPATSYLLTGAGGCDCTHQISTKLGPFSVKR
uniref:Purple acid phosphatase n=1 Tax=Rhabditophanes sp. KR3021 TaxID=114890 RepID=A0AC35TVH7_9BILA